MRGHRWYGSTVSGTSVSVKPRSGFWCGPPVKDDGLPRTFVEVVLLDAGHLGCGAFLIVCEGVHQAKGLVGGVQGIGEDPKAQVVENYSVLSFHGFHYGLLLVCWCLCDNLIRTSFGCQVTLATL